MVGKKWNPESAREYAKRALLDVGISDHEISLVRFGENAIFHSEILGAAIRVYRSPDRLNVANKCFEMGRFLEKEKFPAVRPMKLTDETLTVSGFPVTFWKWERISEVEHFDWGHFGALLRGFQEIGKNFSFHLDAFDPFAKISSRINSLESSGKFKDTEIELIVESYSRCLSYNYFEQNQEDPHVIHADAHRGNTILSESGLLLIDFDNICFGPQDWDALPTLIATRRFDLSETSLQSFLSGFERNIDKKRIDQAIEIKELSMTTWLCQNRGISPEVDNEINHRLDTWRRNDKYSSWNAF